MKKISLFLFSMAIILFFSCEETIIQSDALETNALNLELANNQTVYYLENGEAVIDFYLTNVSDKEIFIPAKFLQNDKYYISQKVQHYCDNSWITDHEILADSLTSISLKPQAFIRGMFEVHEEGIWRTIIPMINNDSIYSKEIIVQEIEYDTLFLPFERIFPSMRMPRDTMMIITTENQYYELWNKFHTGWDGDGNPIPPPKVNFDSLFVVAVSHGYGSASGCSDDVTFIESVYTIKDSTYIKLTNRGWHELGLCLAEVEPRHWITVPQIGLPARFIGDSKY